jgi:hypothetical protein
MPDNSEKSKKTDLESLSLDDLKARVLDLIMKETDKACAIIKQWIG